MMKRIVAVRCMITQAKVTLSFIFAELNIYVGWVSIPLTSHNHKCFYISVSLFRLNPKWLVVTLGKIVGIS